MQAMILAAGIGKRLGKYTRENTKCMVEAAGQTLLMRSISALRKANISRLIMVAGYEAEKLKKYVADHIHSMDIIFVDNEDYEKTNNIYSLYLARNYLLQDDTILLESDLIFDENLIQDLIQFPHPDAATVARYESWMDGTVTLVDANDNIVEFVRKQDFSFTQTGEYYKTVNIYKFSKAFSADYYLPFLEAYIKVYGSNQFYEQVLDAIAQLSNSGLKAFKLTGQKWYEIDDAQDLDIANTLFANEYDEIELYQKRFGGYWRFTELKDFSNLVNPYFPPPNLVDKMKYSFTALLTQYPSSAYMQNINAGCMFAVDEDQLIVGNGAVELIHAMKYMINGRVAVTVPGFNEYPRCFAHCELVKIQARHNDYSLQKADFMAAAAQADTLVIVNPDNPGGSFLDYNELLDIIVMCRDQGKRVIVDESFIDFADPARKYTLIRSGILKAYPNLAVIRSISKSYGVPGLRLGVLASSDQNFMAGIRDNIPIWNINSLGEYFLQNITQYQKEYITACEKLAKERETFARKLTALGFLKVYASQANFLLCEVKPPFTAAGLAKELLRKHKILVKDLSKKEGFEGRQYIRIAVKTEEDNQTLLTALSQETVLLPPFCFKI